MTKESEEYKRIINKGKNVTSINLSECGRFVFIGYDDGFLIKINKIIIEFFISSLINLNLVIYSFKKLFNSIAFHYFFQSIFLI